MSRKPAPLKRRYAVVRTQLVGECDTRSEADEMMNKIKLRKNEWVVVLRNDKEKK